MRSRPWTAWSPETGARAHPRALGPPAITPVFFRAAFSAERRRQGLEAAQHRPQALPSVENWTFRFQQVGSTGWSAPAAGDERIWAYAAHWQEPVHDAHEAVGRLHGVAPELAEEERHAVGHEDEGIRPGPAARASCLITDRRALVE